MTLPLPHDAGRGSGAVGCRLSAYFALTPLVRTPLVFAPFVLTVSVAGVSVALWLVWLVWLDWPNSVMNSSTMRRACSSVYWTAGDFMKYAEGPSSSPPTPASFDSLAQRSASITTPAEFGESQTSNFSSTF